MAAAQAAQDAAAAAFAMVVPANKAKVHLRAFEGKNDDPTDALDFVDKVQGYAQIARLTDEETAQAVAFTVVPNSEAALWLQTQKRENPASVATWAALEPVLLARWCPALTPSQRAAAMDVCKQKKGEGVQAFMDRCRATQLSADRSIPDGDKTGNHVNCYVRRYNTSVLDLFLRGLREEQGLKGHVNGANATTRDEYLAEAIRYEIHVTKPVKMVVVAEVAKEEEAARPSCAGTATAPTTSATAARSRRRPEAAAETAAAAEAAERPATEARASTRCWGGSCSTT